MYRVIIVDDEEWALKGMHRLLQHNADRFRVIFETTNPVEALEKICEEKPDVVLTDVRMPEISGLELMHQVRERGLETNFVVISGFADFSYVQQALQEGAIDYQLKPVDTHKANAMLERLYRMLENKRSIDKLNFYTSLREGGSNCQLLLQSKLRDPLYEKYQVVTVSFKTSDFDKRQLNLGSKYQIFNLKLGPRKCIYIINSEGDKTEVICNTLMDMKDKVRSAGISQSVDNIEKISMLLRNAEQANHDCFTDSTRAISRYSPMNITAVNCLWQKIKEELGNQKYQSLKKIIREIPEYFLTNQLTAEDAVSLWNQVVIFVTSDTKTKEVMTDLEYLDLEGLIEKFPNLESMCEYLYERLPCSQETVQVGTVNHQFNQLLEFIDHHYMDELYLKELCNQFFINISYCCELFRKSLNMTFSQYITSLRLKYACELLQNSQLSIQEICERIGYNDYFYFSKVFKRNLSCTPFEYRKSKEQR